MLILFCYITGTLNRKFHINSHLYAAKKDYYNILGVSRNASSKDVKKAYYQLAKKYHPDTSKDDPNAAKKFQEVSEAYEVGIKNNSSSGLISVKCNSIQKSGRRFLICYGNAMGPMNNYRKIS